MKKVTLLGIDLSKNYFQLHGVNQQGEVILKKKVKREKLSETIINIPPCQIVMESCSGAHYWERIFMLQRHEVKLIAPHNVTPYRRGQKNDARDAETIAEAASRPELRFIPIKSAEQQDIQSLHRARERYIHERTALSNHLRGLLLEYGIAIRKGISYLRHELPRLLEEKEIRLSSMMKCVLNAD